MQNSKKRKFKFMTFKEYDDAMKKIILKHATVADALIEMIQFSSGVKLKGVKNEKKKT
jgi:hypothetical protein